MVINYITAENEIDIKELNANLYKEACINNIDVISNLKDTNKDFLISVLMMNRRASIEDHIQKSLKCVVSKELGKSIISAIKTNGFTELEDIYPIKMTFESGLFHAYWRQKVKEKNLDGLFASRYITSRYSTNDETNFLSIRQYAVDCYESGNYKDALSSMSYLTDVINEDFVLQVMMGNIYTFFVKDKDKAIEKYSKAITIMSRYNNLIKETSQIMYFIGCIYLYHGKYEKAIEFLRDAIDTYKDTEYVYRLAEAYSLMRDEENCLNQIERLLTENVYYSLEVQYCHNFTPFREKIRLLIEDVSAKYITEYITNMRKGQEYLSLVNLNVPLEGAEAIKDEVIRISSRVNFDCDSICLINSYKGCQYARNYATIAEAYSKVYHEGLNIKSLIERQNFKLKNISSDSNYYIEEKLKNLSKQYSHVKSNAENFFMREKKLRKYYFMLSLSIVIAAWTFMRGNIYGGAILISGWAICTALIFALDIYGRKARKLNRECEGLEANIRDAREARIEEWQIKKNFEREIKKDINALCDQYNYILNKNIFYVNTKLGLNIEEVKINFV